MLNAGVTGGEEDKYHRLSVLPQSLDEIPVNLKKLMNRYGISDDIIISAIEERSVTAERQPFAE